VFFCLPVVVHIFKHSTSSVFRKKYAAHAKIHPRAQRPYCWSDKVGTAVARRGASEKQRKDCAIACVHFAMLCWFLCG
jgi:hypothetical protein